ncbi:MAG: putative periplasmic lipoprotein [Planctomycetota bacterium]|jgi:hypothetical protein
MKRLTMLCLVLGLVGGSLAACGGGAPEEETIPELRVGEVSESVPVTIGEYGTEKTRGRSKTIEWLKIGTTLGTRYLGGTVVVDRIIRDDAHDLYGVQVRLKNTTPDMLPCDARIFFLSENGERILGEKPLKLTTERPEDWTQIIFEPYGFVTVTDTARMRGAVGFDLRVRRQGIDGEGLPGSPDIVEEPVPPGEGEEPVPPAEGEEPVPPGEMPGEEPMPGEGEEEMAPEPEPEPEPEPDVPPPDEPVPEPDAPAPPE